MSLRKFYGFVFVAFLVTGLVGPSLSCCSMQHKEPVGPTTAPTTAPRPPMATKEIPLAFKKMFPTYENITSKAAIDVQIALYLCAAEEYTKLREFLDNAPLPLDDEHQQRFREQFLSDSLRSLEPEWYTDMKEFTLRYASRQPSHEFRGIQDILFEQSLDGFGKTDLRRLDSACVDIFVEFHKHLMQSIDAINKDKDARA
jgi:hypothetical protein